MFIEPPSTACPDFINDFSDSNQITVLQFFHFSGYNKALEK
jgi:hypothetical protein